MNGKTIICLANNYFFDPTSKHHVMRELAKSNHVLWINWHASRRPALNRRDFSSIAEKLKQFKNGLAKVQERLWVLAWAWMTNRAGHRARSPRAHSAAPDHE